MDLEYECQSCGHLMTIDDFKDYMREKWDLKSSDPVGVSGDNFTKLQEAEQVILVDCPECPDTLATYKKNTIEPEEQSDGHSKPENDALGRSEPNSGSTKPFSIA